ncbi:Sec14 cytosolic factor [Protomyces lactucae-debilis]|uniref:Sec14 cytosolic factor n=1 Tax=Protomyces lactucae-debilis TaxID=2754530 RepID=A0A1Y2EWR2_PROLT|nr:Sec14 cytosolic factor [Protomyces lactucae-debilis]ORY76019.1 Sec14 cytosolic factor [Protomyces lactucae-debilis]
MASLDSYPQTCPSAGLGYPGNLTAEQQTKLEQLRSELVAESYKERTDDASLLRFLRARKFDVALAKAMFIDCENWRKSFGVDELKRSFDFKEKEQISKFYPQYYHKTDKDGRPIYIEQLGGIDLKKMYEISTHERMIQNLVVEYEKFTDNRLPACSRMKGELVETSCTIMDLKGVGITSISSVYSYVKSASAIGQNYYPERMGKFYMINAPWGFSTAFGMIKSLLDEVTAKKIHILGSHYKDELLKQIPPQNLPKKFGGTSETAGPVELSDEGPWTDPAFASPAATATEPKAALISGTATTSAASPAAGTAAAI